MSLINTYMFMDLEATGLPKKENNQTKITELSLVAVSRQHLLGTKAGETPRVQCKITLCFNPRRTITLEARRISGLTNELLEEQPAFDSNICSLLDAFFSLLPGPVCLLSHAGNRLDFPVLKGQVLEACASLRPDLRYIDTLDVFYCLMEPNRYAGTRFPFEKRRKAYSYKLKDIYMRLLKRGPPYMYHNAEADCITILECAVALSTKFVNWVDQHSGLFSVVKPLS